MCLVVSGLFVTITGQVLIANFLMLLTIAARSQSVSVLIGAGSSISAFLAITAQAILAAYSLVEFSQRFSDSALRTLFDRWQSTSPMGESS